MKNLLELKKLYIQQTKILTSIFPDWNEEDLVLVIHEANGDLDTSLSRILEGTTSKWTETKKKIKRGRSMTPKPIRHSNPVPIKIPNVNRSISPSLRSPSPERLPPLDFP